MVIGRILTIVFWILFLGLFISMAIPKFVDFVRMGWPDYMGPTWLNNRLWFLLHMTFGTVVYVAGFIQFNSYIRNNYIRFHRKVGKLYILSSLICISTLFRMLPDGMCVACRPSQYIVTCLWLLFVVLAYFFIRQRRIVLHQRMMILSYICAAYFVTVRVVDRYAMKFFRSLFNEEPTALLISDLSVWVIPIAFAGIFWLITDKRKLIAHSA